jgi:hypothetical protein
MLEFQNKYMKNMSDTTVFSLHSFMFPFTWNYIKSSKRTRKFIYSDRTRLEDFNRLFTQCKSLQRAPFTIGKNAARYNEYTYFHDFVKTTLYDTDNTNLPSELYYYELNGEDGDNYTITTQDKSYKLSIESVSLHVFNSGIGIFVFNLRNTEHCKIADILTINDVGRRIYPQYLGEDMSLEAPQSSFLAKSISGKIGAITFDENFTKYNNALEPGNEFLPPDHILKFFGYNGESRMGNKEMAFVFCDKDEDEGKIRLKKIMDDRMFILCYYNNKNWANSLGVTYKKSTKWYAFLFGDSHPHDIKLKNEDLLESLLTKHTYARWSNTFEIDTNLRIAGKIKDVKNNTLYGMTRDSFVCLGNWPLLESNMKTMYYQLSILTLLQRGSILRFSYEIASITNLFEMEIDPTHAIKDLYRNYIKFKNKIHNREATSGIQGYEMYRLALDVMNIESDIKNLSSEIKELHNYISIVEQSLLSKIAMWFLPAGVLVGLFGMNTFSDSAFRFQSYSVDWISIGWLVFIVALSIAMVYMLSFIMKKRLK